jgi:hypothetical protein
MLFQQTYFLQQHNLMLSLLNLLQFNTINLSLTILQQKILNLQKLLAARF